MRLIQKEIYTFSELSDSAKEKARNWWRNGLDSDYAEYVIEDSERVAAILGIEFKTSTVRLYGGGTREKPNVYWSGFWSQGDGASFEGYYSYAKGCAKKIREYAPQDSELHRIADELTMLQKRQFFGIIATVRHSGRYSHSGCMSISVDHNYDDNRITRECEDSVTQLMRDYADWIYKQLESAYEEEISDKVVDENIIANEYEFDENGNRA